MTEVSDTPRPEMSNNFEPSGLPVQHHDAPRVRLVLLAQFGLFVLCMGIYQVIALLSGWENAPMLTADASAAERWTTRLQLGLGHFLGFSVASFLTVWLFYRNITREGPDWKDYLGVRRLPNPSLAGLSVLLMTVSLPLVLFLLNINQLIPLPESLKLAEEQTNEAIKSLLQMDHVGELLANLVIIALLPAIGEELMFRGDTTATMPHRQSLGRVADLGGHLQFCTFSVRRFFAAHDAGHVAGLAVLAHAKLLGSSSWRIFSTTRSRLSVSICTERMFRRSISKRMSGFRGSRRFYRHF